MITRIWGGRVIDPGHIDKIKDVIIEDGKIIGLKDSLPEKSREPGTESKIIDASGKIVTPGLIDMHVHLREPGHEYMETIRSGCLSAAAGGFTSICAMPNTDPVNDNRQTTEYILKKAGSNGPGVRVFPVAAITKRLQGKSLCGFEELKNAGAIAFSDDGRPVMDSQIMRRALESANAFQRVIISHAEDLGLSQNGVMNEGRIAKQMGLTGIPNAAESIMVMRDIALCELTGAPIHIAHVSTRESVYAIRDAKTRGIRVTAETAPHYFTLCEEAVKDYHTNAKMNPPLRSIQDQKAIIAGLADGTIDAIASDHAPHCAAEKEIEFALAANGIIGFETSLSLGLKLVENRLITIIDLVEKMSINPARILGLKSGLQIGSPADITIIDPDISYEVDSNRFQSLSRNTPFDGWRMKGKAVLTMVGGKVIFDESA
ncbi:MAG: dihydroorotase [Desulfobacterales bacterium]